jgi:protein TonB
MFSHEWEGYQKLYAAPDEMPDLVGGLSGFLDRLTALRGAGECPSGRIVVQFIIGESGTVLDSATREGEEHPCEALAVRTIRESKFIPGKEDGKPVKTVMSLPVTFK